MRINLHVMLLWLLLFLAIATAVGISTQRAAHFMYSRLASISLIIVIINEWIELELDGKDSA